MDYNSMPRKELIEELKTYENKFEQILKEKLVAREDEISNALEKLNLIADRASEVLEQQNIAKAEKILQEVYDIEAQKHNLSWLQRVFSKTPIKTINPTTRWELGYYSQNLEQILKLLKKGE